MSLEEMNKALRSIGMDLLRLSIDARNTDISRGDIADAIMGAANDISDALNGESSD